MSEMIFSLPGLAVAIALIAAGAIQGSTGFGFNMLAAPLLAIIDPSFVPGPMLALATIVCIGGALREYADVHRRDLAFSLFGRVIAASLAALCLGLLSPQIFSALFGLSVLAAVVLSLVGLQIQATPKTLFAAGAISGFMGTLTSIGSAPMALVYQNTTGARMRATLNAFFVLGGLLSIIALALVGQFGRSDIVLAAFMTPPAFIGFLLSGYTRNLVDRGHVKTVVLVVSTLSGLTLLWKAFG
ncbi:MAG: sulfite exporter TauE/SafE family protein [Shinella sp.]|uniref:TSUP family transporter n=1 Tax=Shinella sp. TaxID=1870904 RepID=UPI003C754EBF